MKTNVIKTAKAGFSLVEMLVVIAVIGIIAAIAIPTIGNITDAAKVGKDKRNAQNLASVYSTAIAAGHVFAASDKAAVANELIAGVFGDADAGFGTTEFRVNLGADARDDCLTYLDADFNYTGN